MDILKKYLSLVLLKSQSQYQRNNQLIKIKSQSLKKTIKK
jgi:hypothetical protein